MGRGRGTEIDTARRLERWSPPLPLSHPPSQYEMLSTSGNFFNGGGVYVLLEHNDNKGRTFDCEFNFLPGGASPRTGSPVTTPLDPLLT